MIPNPPGSGSLHDLLLVPDPEARHGRGGGDSHAGDQNISWHVPADLTQL
jgi:hypothetical protein